MMQRIAGVLSAALLFVAGMAIFNATRSDPEPATDVEAAAEIAPATTSTTTTSTTTTTTTTTTLPPPRSARLAFTGDLLPHGSVQRAGTAFVAEGWDFAPLYEEVQPIIEGADLAICHLETPISIDDTNLSGYPLFSAPRAFAQAALDVGYDGCSLASNHSYDRGAQGALDTITVLQEIGLPYAGQAASDEEDLAPVLYDANGITIAHISATYSLNGFLMPSDRQYLVDLIEPGAILHEARIAKESGAEFVIVSMHWGAEYRHEPISSQNEWLEATLPSEYVDLIIGHHAHVVQPVDKVGDEWVVFGLGNFLSNQSANCCVAASQDGMIATVELLENDTGQIEAVGVHYIPTWVDRGDGYIIRVADPPAPTSRRRPSIRWGSRSIEHSTSSAAASARPTVSRLGWGPRPATRRSSRALRQQPTDDHFQRKRLVSTLEDRQHPGIDEVAADCVFLGVPHAAVDLHRLAGDPFCGSAHVRLCHRGLQRAVAFCHQFSDVQAELSAGLNDDGHPAELGLGELVLRDRLGEDHAVVGVALGVLIGGLHHSDRSGCGLESAVLEPCIW